MPTDGVCCAEVFYDAEGVCCGGVFYAEDGEEQGDCCGDVWYALPEGESLPNRDVLPFVPIVWETDQCPENTSYARYGDYGECCGCTQDEVFDPRVGEGSPPPGGMVPTETVIDDLCCDPCPGPLYLPFNAYGEYIGCNGVCCADDDCSRLPEFLCAAGVHPTAPSASHYLWRQFAAEQCCGPTACQTKCCVGNDLVEKAVFEVVGLVEGDNEWVVDIGGEQYSASSSEGGVVTTDDIAAKLVDRITGYLGQPSTSAISSGSTITVIGPDAGTATITPPGGSPTEPVSITTDITFAQCNAIGGLPRVGDRCPCQTGARCCEDATSSGLLLSFNKPSALIGTVRVTVTGHTTSPILVHGTLKGPDATPTNRCRFSHTFLLCYGTFNIEPVPCGSTFHRLVVEVCYEGHETSTESFAFSGCDDITVYLGECGENCVTTMTYSGAGATSNASVLLSGDGVIEANGSGPLVLTGNITPVGLCTETLTLTGTSTAENTITGLIQDSTARLGVRKTGVGTWKLTGNSSYTGHLRVREGTLIVGSVDNTGTSPFGGDLNNLPHIGDPGTSSSIPATLLTTGTINRSFYVEQGGGSQVVTIGGTGTGFTLFQAGVNVLLGRGVTLQASTGGTVTFANYWLDFSGGINPAVGFNIGSAGNEGTVVLNWYLPVAATSVNVRHGTLRLDYSDQDGGTIWQSTPVTVGDTATSVTLIINGIDQPLSDLTFKGSGSDITGPSGGILRLVDSPTVTITDTGHEISSAVALDDDATFDGTGSLLISGVVSGASGVTMDGSGTISLSGANTYTGTTTINSGTMKAQSLTAFGTGDIVVNAGGTLDKNGYAITNTITNNGGTVIN